MYLVLSFGKPTDSKSEKEKNANYGGWVVGGGRGENGDTRGEGTGGTGVEEKET